MSEKQNDGGPAFPVVGTVGPIGRIEATGISIRDYFAIHAPVTALYGTSHEALARSAYEYADAMMKERTK